MLTIYNSLGKKPELFAPANKNVVTLFTCGPSVYQRAHIGNFRTFLFEDVLVRYLQYSGYQVLRGMNFTDMEDKAIAEAEKNHTTVEYLTEKNIAQFLDEMRLLGMQMPDYLPKASEHVDDAVAIIQRLLQEGIAYWHGRNVYFDPLRFPGFGKLYGLDLSQWPGKKRRFHKDTYPGIQWNRGDFVLWHGYKEGDEYVWNSAIGRGRPSWNIQDPSMIHGHFNETLSFYCGGIDNLFRHHDYILAILESIRPYPMASYWLHCHHLTVKGQKMSKSRGNICYTDALLDQGYSAAEVRFFLIYNQYRSQLDYTDDLLLSSARMLREFQCNVAQVRQQAGQGRTIESRISQELRNIFTRNMDDDLNVKSAFDGIDAVVSGLPAMALSTEEAGGIITALREIDSVLKVIF